MAVPKAGFRVLAIVAFVVLVSSCGGVETGSSIGPPPVDLKDAPPGQLASYIAITLGGYDAATRDSTTIFIGFTSKGRVVNFVGGQRLICNGRALTMFTGHFEESLPTAALAGNRVNCLYTSGQQSADLSFRVPLGLVILSPREQESVARSPLTAVSYGADPEALPAVVALGPESKAVARLGASTADHATIDTSALQPGAGSISLSQFLAVPDVQGPLFQSVGGRAQAMTIIQVTWT